VIAYASRTGTRRNLEALRGAGWRLMVSARGVWRSEGFPYALDNGAWTAHARGEPFDVAAFQGVLEQLGAGADFVVVPDIVCGGMASLRLSERWLPRLEWVPGDLLIPVQNGMAPADLRPIVGGRIGLFVGGDTEWKERTAAAWGELAAERGCWLHVGRVNTARRIRICHLAGARSFDGSSASRFCRSLGRLDAARRQIALPGLAPNKSD
jgi:hypothetical protein